MTAFISSNWDIAFLMLFLLLIMTTTFVIVRERQKRKIILSKLDSHLSESDFQQFSPPLISQLIIGTGAYTHHISAGLLNLVRQEILTLNHDKALNTYYFSVADSSVKTSSLHEDFLIKWMLYEVGNHGVFYVDDLFNFTENNQRREQFIQKLDEWEQLMQQELVQHGLFSRFSLYKKTLLGLTVTMLLLGSIFIFVSPLISLFYLLSGLITFIALMSSSSITHEGLSVYKKWYSYSTQLKTLSTKNINTTTWLMASYVFAIGFGLKETYLEKFPIREASQLSLRQDHFPLYFSIAPGTTAISLESVKIVDDLESSVDQIISPVGFSTENSDAISGSSLE